MTIIDTLTTWAISDPLGPINWTYFETLNKNLQAVILTFKPMKNGDQGSVRPKYSNSSLKGHMD